MPDPILKIIQHGSVKAETFADAVHESAKDAAEGLLNDLEEQARYNHIANNPICVGLLPMRLGDDSFYVCVAAFVIDRSDTGGANLLAAFGPAVRHMLQESAQIPETVLMVPDKEP